MICIYKATNKINGKVYIGKTNNFKARKLAHETKLNDHLFSRAIQKYGKENFDWIILEDGITSLEESNERERYWIAKYRSYFRWKDSNGYNMTRGGDGGSDWNIRKVAAYSLDGILIKAFDSVSECAEYYDISGTSEISRVCDNNNRSCCGMMFRYFETSPLSKIPPHHYENSRKTPICQLDMAGNILKRYNGIMDAEKDGHNRTGIIGCIKGYYRTSGGFQWCYERELPFRFGVNIKPIKGVPVLQYDLNDNLIGVFNSCAEAARRNGFSTYKQIHKALSSKSHIAHGFKWLKNTSI